MAITKYTTDFVRNVERDAEVRSVVTELLSNKSAYPGYVEKNKDSRSISDLIALNSGSKLGAFINCALSPNYSRTFLVEVTNHNLAGALLNHYFNTDMMVRDMLFRTFVVEGKDFQIYCPAVGIDDCFYYNGNRFLMGSDMLSKLNELKAAGYSFRGMYVREIEVLEYDTTIKNCPRHCFHRINYYSNTANAVCNITL